MPRARELLDRQPADLRGFEWRYLDRAFHCGLATSNEPRPIRAVVWNPDGRTFAVQADDGLTIRDGTTLKVLWSAPHYSTPAFSSPAFNGDGTRMVIWRGGGFAVVPQPTADSSGGTRTRPSPVPASRRCPSIKRLSTPTAR